MTSQIPVVGKSLTFQKVRMFTQKRKGAKGSIPGSGSFRAIGNGNPLQLSLPGKSHGQGSLAGYNPWGRKESDMTW